MVPPVCFATQEIDDIPADSSMRISGFEAGCSNRFARLGSLAGGVYNDAVQRRSNLCPL